MQQGWGITGNWIRSIHWVCKKKIGFEIHGTIVARMKIAHCISNFQWGLYNTDTILDGGVGITVHNRFTYWVLQRRWGLLYNNDNIDIDLLLPGGRIHAEHVEYSALDARLRGGRGHSRRRASSYRSRHRRAHHRLRHQVVHLTAHSDCASASAPDADYGRALLKWTKR